MIPDLTEAAADLAASPVVVGFDAFIDETQRVVEERRSAESCTPMATITDFAAWAAAAAGRSGGRECLSTGREAGGCAVNQGDGLAALGVPVDAFVTTGDPLPEVFAGFRARVRSHQHLGLEPGRSTVFEFDDGKLLFGCFDALRRVTPELLRSRLEAAGYRAAVAQARAVVLTCWSVYPHMTACWRMLQQTQFAGLTHAPAVFLDLADPVNRTADEVRDMAAALRGFTDLGPVTLSVNENEARLVAAAVGVQADAIGDLAIGLHRQLAIHELVVHRVRDALAVSADGLVQVPGPWCARPVRSVGAGDRFNAGHLVGTLLGLDAIERLALGNASSGFFVRQGRSGTLEEVMEQAAGPERGTDAATRDACAVIAEKALILQENSA